MARSAQLIYVGFTFWTAGCIWGITAFGGEAYYNNLSPLVGLIR